MKINLVMIVKNEERTLEKCLKGAASLVDDIVIADTGSEDRTKEIAGAMGAKVWHCQWNDNFADARNYALEHSDGDWNLVLDADEVLHPCDRHTLEQAVRRISEKHGQRWLGALIRYDAYRDGSKTGISTSPLPRLLPKGMRYAGIIHEQPDTDFPLFLIPLAADHDGYLYQDKGERNLPYLEKAVRQYPEDAYYQFQMAATLRNMNRLQDSLGWFQAFYEAVPEEAGYRADGVLLYLYTLLDLNSLSALEEAGTVLKREEAVLGTRADFCFLRGLFYMKLILADTEANIRFLPEIEASYKECMRIGEHPELGGVVGTGSFLAAYNLGLWYEVSGQLGEAGLCYRKSAAAGFGPAGERLKLLGAE
ncbi:MAG: glycosyltransferase family 2 protein [Clostridiales bacterium]|nr:glycosyltransferase family 2 protein [Clostridiales bacterium]